MRLKNQIIYTIRLVKIDDIDVNKILFSKEEPYGLKIHSDTLLDAMIMMLLDRYA